MSRLHLQPERVTEIQQALAKAGYLHQEPTGEWDDPTRQAMREFQQAHGFTPTGLPEAKPLIVLGLGPHPVPPGPDPRLAVQASTEDKASTADPPSGQGSAAPSPK
jgi:peptidoglycan hydrolase-like protein with peptidoglycan-binding domain